jgi:hypothetical protein
MKKHIGCHRQNNGTSEMITPLIVRICEYVSLNGFKRDLMNGIHILDYNGKIFLGYSRGSI